MHLSIKTVIAALCVAIESASPLILDVSDTSKPSMPALAPALHVASHKSSSLAPYTPSVHYTKPNQNTQPQYTSSAPSTSTQYSLAAVGSQSSHKKSIQSIHPQYKSSQPTSSQHATFNKAHASSPNSSKSSPNDARTFPVDPRTRTSTSPAIQHFVPGSRSATHIGPSAVASTSGQAVFSSPHWPKPSLRIMY